MEDTTFEGPLLRYLKLHGLHALPLHTQLEILQQSLKHKTHAVKPVFPTKQEALWHAMAMFRTYAKKHLYEGMFHKRPMSRGAGSSKEYMGHAFEQ